MGEVVTIGLDIAKSVFQAIRLRMAPRVALRARLRQLAHPVIVQNW